MGRTPAAAWRPGAPPFFHRRLEGGCLHPGTGAGCRADFRLYSGRRKGRMSHEDFDSPDMRLVEAAAVAGGLDYPRLMENAGSAAGRMISLAL